MEEIVQYVELSEGLIAKQAEQIRRLTADLVEARGRAGLEKQSAEDVLDSIASRLEKDRYTPESVCSALRRRDPGLLAKAASHEPVDSWGTLVDGPGKMDNIRPSDLALYKRLRLI